MRQFFLALSTLLNRSQVWLSVIIVCLATYIVFTATSPDPTSRPLAEKAAEQAMGQQESQLSTIEGTTSLAADNASKLALSALRLQSLQLEYSRSQQEIEQRLQELRAAVEHSDEISDRILQHVASIEARTTQARKEIGRSSLKPIEARHSKREQNQLVKLEPEARSSGRVAVIDSGARLPVVLLASVNAPVDGAPWPVVFKVVGEIKDRDGRVVPVKEAARLIAAAQGSLADSRALFRLKTLSIRHPNGQRNEVAIDGWIENESEGGRGIAGELIDPVGKGIAGVSIVGPLLPPKHLPYRQMLKELPGLKVPSVLIPSGKKATAVFTKSIEIPLPE